MARIPNPDTDFPINVEGVGTFVIARRKFNDEIKIQIEYAKIVDGSQPTEWLHLVGTWLSTFKVLIVKSPSDWNIDEMDPMDGATYEKMARVYKEIQDKELSFRKRPVPASQAAGEGSGGLDRVPVAEEIQHSGD